MAKARHRRWLWSRRLQAQAGTSLIEVLIASALMLVGAISVLPLFVRATFNNLSGFDSSQATSYSRSELEDLIALTIDHERLNLAAPVPARQVRPVVGGGDELVLAEVYWDQAADAPSTAEVRLGDGNWISDPSAAKGTVFWQRTSLIRQHSYADISSGVIDISNPGQLLTLGHPKLFDRPLAAAADPSMAQFKVEDIELASQRAGGRLSGVGNLRTRYFRIH